MGSCDAKQLGRSTAFHISSNHNTRDSSADFEYLGKNFDAEGVSSGYTEAEAGAKQRYKLLLEQREAWTYKWRVLGRALYLLFSYCPVIFTSGIAYFSESFRSVFWYNMLRGTIAYSGAVR